jgi:hypothetical protein
MKAGSGCLAIVLASCGGGQPTTDHSHAADEIIDNAKTPEERAELTRVRDEVDAAAQARIRQLDAEIARLEKENAEIRKR